MDFEFHELKPNINITISICEQFLNLDILLLRLLQRIVTSLGVTRLIELIFSLHFRGMFNTSQCSVFLYQSSYKVEG